MSEGVSPLVCAACSRVVGVINADSLDRMTESGEAYICEECMESADVENKLAQRDNWLGLTGAEIARPGQLFVTGR